MKIENVNNFDINTNGKTLDEAQTDKESPSKDIKINGVSIYLSSYTLIFRRYSRNTKEKTLIDLSCVQSTKVKRITKPTFLILSILLFVLGSGATYPLYLYVKNYAFISLGAGIIFGILFLVLYMNSRQIQISINLSNGKALKLFSNDVKSFDNVNNFFDELFYNKHNN